MPSDSKPLHGQIRIDSYALCVEMRFHCNFWRLEWIWFSWRVREVVWEASGKVPMREDFKEGFQECREKRRDPQVMRQVRSEVQCWLLRCDWRGSHSLIAGLWHSPPGTSRWGTGHLCKWDLWRLCFTSPIPLSAFWERQWSRIWKWRFWNHRRGVELGPCCLLAVRCSASFLNWL